MTGCVPAGRFAFKRQATRLCWMLVLSACLTSPSFGETVSGDENGGGDTEQIATPESLAAPMRGLYASVATPDSPQELGRLKSSLESNPYLEGVLVAVRWSDVEPEDGRFDFEALDEFLEAIRETGKKYKFKVMTGIYSPEWIYASGAQRFDTVIANPNRATYGDPVSIPVPWDQGYQRLFSRLIQAMGERYSDDPACVAVTLTCANFMSAEMHLPKSPEDMKTWEQFGLSAERLLSVYRQYMDEWARAFPRQLVCLHKSNTANLREMTPNEFVEQITLYGLERRPRQFALQNNQLHGRREMPDDPDNPLLKYKDTLINGYQSLASFDSTPERQGSIEMSVLNYIKADSEYWELWSNDGMNPETCKKVLDALATAQSLGQDAYKEKLIADGLYRLPEDDTWAETQEQIRREKDEALAGESAGAVQ